MVTNREVFDAIASTWYGVRHWPLLPRELGELVRRWRHGTLVNLGCGTGSDFTAFPESFRMVGVDFSRGMLRQAQRRLTKHGVRAALTQGDLRRLPFVDRSVDYAIGIACYHHIEGDAARAEAFVELRRVLRPGGEAFLSVWNHDQPRFRGASRDQFVPWRKGGTVLRRYYHLFTLDELQAALLRAGFQVVRIGHGAPRGDEAENDPRNICALVRRPADAESAATNSVSEEPG